MRTVKNTVKTVTVMLSALCIGASVFGCGEEYLTATEIAKQQFGCVKILWTDAGVYINNISGYYVESGGGKVGKDKVFPMQGGSYVVGEDKNGNEVFVLVPYQKEGAHDSRYKPAKYDWPFEYSFREIATFAGEYGYPYADGIEGRKEEFYSDFCRMYICDTEYHVKHAMLGIQEYYDIDAIYDRMDVKLMFEFRHEPSDDLRNNYFITQENGELKMYELNNRGETGIITYVRNNNEA